MRAAVRPRIASTGAAGFEACACEWSFARFFEGTLVRGTERAVRAFDAPGERAPVIRQPWLRGERLDLEMPFLYLNPNLNPNLNLYLYLESEYCILDLKSVSVDESA